jgi:hypothetical protein
MECGVGTTGVKRSYSNMNEFMRMHNLCKTVSAIKFGKKWLVVWMDR